MHKLRTHVYRLDRSQNINSKLMSEHVLLSLGYDNIKFKVRSAHPRWLIKQFVLTAPIW